MHTKRKSRRPARHHGTNLIYTAIAAAFLMVAGVVFFGQHARAADLGGNCCADLEERIAELEATTARKGNRKVSLTVYGTVNEALLYVDTDAGHTKDFRTNNIDPTRFGFVGTAKVSEGIKAGYQIEVGLDSYDALKGSRDVEVRDSHVWIETALGTFAVGRTTTATKDIAAISVVDLGSASKSLSLGPVGMLAPTGIVIDTAYNGRFDQVAKYVSPSLGGFSVSASYSGDDSYDVAARYAGEFGGFKVSAGIGYAYVTNGVWAASVQYLSGSASVQHATSGLFLNAAFGANDAKLDGDNASWAVQAGDEIKLTSYGSTVAFAEYGQVAANTLLTISGVPLMGTVSGPVTLPDLSYYGAGLAQHIDAAAMTLYVGWRRYDLDGAGSADVVLAGARVRF